MRKACTHYTGSASSLVPLSEDDRVREGLLCSRRRSQLQAGTQMVLDALSFVAQICNTCAS
jgi:hypothetical protein